MLPGIVALACGRMAMSDLMRRNMLERLAAIAVPAMVINVTLNLVLIPTVGALGAALASLVSYTTQASLAIAVDRRAGASRRGPWSEVAPISRISFAPGRLVR